MKFIISFLKKEIVLSVAWIFAIISAFFVKPSAEYLSYIDFRSLGILWSLMIIMKAFSSEGIFELTGNILLSFTKKIWQLAAVLIGLCFFSSMLITNDVALITFVPFTILMLNSCNRNDLLIPVIVLQTVAANLGSMLTPIGNPQNLYLYSLMNCSLLSFLKLMIPYSAASFIFLALSILFLKGKNQSCTNSSSSSLSIKPGKLSSAVYSLLFITAVFTVLRIIPFYVLCIIVLAVTVFLKPSILLKADYALLLTFCGFFIFTGNLAKIDSIKSVLERITAGHETVTGIITSQAISNVPAALLLSGFSTDLRALTAGVNLGGLGTLIASMASLISYKFYAKTENSRRLRYLAVFTAINLIFLAILLGQYFILRNI